MTATFERRKTGVPADSQPLSSLRHNVALDWRNIENGLVIPTIHGYADQPYLVKADDGAWVLAVTTSPGREGDSHQGVYVCRSEDCGQTWSQPVPVESMPAGGGYEASYAVLLKAPSGRIFIFYNHNTDNIRNVVAGNHQAEDPAFSGGRCVRVDSLGYFVFKYSDDHGATWSRERIPIPVRPFEIDDENPYGGKIRFFWNVGKAFSHEGTAYVPLHKVGGFGAGFFSRSEGALLASRDLLAAGNPATAGWETLPDGKIGLRTPAGGGPIAEEQSFSPMGDGSFFVVYRTIDGHPACSYSRDRGRSWTEPEWMTYASGRRIRHPRGANFAWRLQNGKWIYWFHNNGGKWYENRNPAWICLGEEVESPDGVRIAWSEPEILLYGEGLYARLSYPDLLEDAGRIFITETNKSIARVHVLDEKFLRRLFASATGSERTREGLVLEHRFAEELEGVCKMPELRNFVLRERGWHVNPEGTRSQAGFSLEVVFELESWRPGQVLIDSRLPDGRGLALRMSFSRTIEFVMGDGRQNVVWDTDPGVVELGRRHHLGVIVDGGPRIITMLVDGAMCDGGKTRDFGFSLFSSQFESANGAPELRTAVDLEGRLEMVRLYDHALLSNEVAANYRAAMAEKMGEELVRA